ncbi:MAG: Acetyl-coenzyme A carboxylase carboxyl transferase subunit beta [Firmicutes bacterium ADurb.Bin146]|nr:MAG: Acetyl-coenzyme A carboxylase carboxyl transferase subunit beta [Firmicutes bacterium ADurb.Bin146]
MLFKKPKNSLEGNPKIQFKLFKDKTDTLSKELFTCKKCKKAYSEKELSESFNVCPFCNEYYRISARERLDILCDSASFIEHDSELTSVNILGFEGYDEKLSEAKKQSKENESVVCGVCNIEGIKTAIFVMDPFFMMGSMGSVTGEKITRLFEYATDNKLPVVGYCVSGGARMQEGIMSLMQMAKVSAAVKRHSDANNPYICILTDPTSGGVTASFAMQADIILSEPGALVCFAGPRVIEQTIKKKVPDDIQRAECVMKNGFIDNIIGRKSQKSYIGKLLRMHMRYEA